MAKKRTKPDPAEFEKTSSVTESNSSENFNGNQPDAVSLPLSDTFVFVGFTIVCLLVYGQVIRFEYINLDDNLYVYSNPVVTNGLSLQGVRWAFTVFHSANWHPLTWISHMIDVSLFGVNPGMHHAVNVIFHLINSFLVFGVFHKLTRRYWSSVIIAFLFAFHPAHVESVAWVSERKDVLSTLFWLLTMWAYIRYARQEGDKKLNYGLVLLFFILGLMSKPMLVTLPFVLLLLDYYPLERLTNKRDVLPLLIEKIPLFILTIASSVVTVMAQKSGGAVAALTYIPLLLRIVNTIFSYAKYVLMLFYPTKLGVMYPYQYSFNLWLLIAAIIFLIGVTALCLWQAKRRKYLIVGWLWFLGTLVPVIGLVQVGGQALADRYTYIPYLGLFVMLVWGGAEIFEKLKINKSVVIAGCCVVMLILSGMTYKQVSYWKSAETLYEHTLSITKDNVLITDNYCLNLIQKNALREANEKCVLLATDHNYPNAYNTWGIIQVKLENYDVAIKNFQRSISITPNYPLPISNLAVALTKTGKLDEAAIALQRADEVNDGSLTPVELASNYSLIGINYIQQNKPDKAIPLFVKALILNPARADIRMNYGAALSMQGKYDEALKQLDESIKLDPNQAETYNALGLVFLGQNKKDEAIKQFEKALQLKPDLASAKKNLERAKGNEK